MEAAIWNMARVMIERFVLARECLACQRGWLPGHRHMALDDQPIPFRVRP